jgi:hypothetical protein
VCVDVFACTWECAWACECASAFGVMTGMSSEICFHSSEIITLSRERELTWNL